MTDETLDGVFINPGFFGMCNKCFTAVMRVMRRDTEGLNSLIKVASIEFIAGVAIRTISAGKIEWISDERYFRCCRISDVNGSSYQSTGTCLDWTW